MAFIAIWLVLLTVVAVAALVVGLVALSRVSQRTPGYQPQYPVQYGQVPPAASTSPPGYPQGPPAYPPATQWVRRNPCSGGVDGRVLPD